MPIYRPGGRPDRYPLGKRHPDGPACVPMVGIARLGLAEAPADRSHPGFDRRLIAARLVDPDLRVAGNLPAAIAVG